MFKSLNPHTDYSVTNLPNLDRLPRGWSTPRLREVSRMLVSNVDKLSEAGEEPVRLCNYVDVYKHEYISDRIAFMKATARKEEIRQFRLRRDDVLITKDSESWTDIAVPAYVTQEAEDLLCGYHLAILRTRKEALSGEYLFRALQVPQIAYQFHVAAGGVTRYGLSHEDIKSARIPLPPLQEQAAIVRYLAYANWRIDQTIAAKRKLIRLLEEQKQVIINQAVTRGVDPTVPTKFSGIDWLGDIPAGWQVAPMRRYWTVKDCKHVTVPFVDEGIPLASVTQAQRFYLDLSDAKRTTKHYFDSLIEGGRAPRRGDLVYCRNVGVGFAAVVDTDESFAMGQDVCLLRSEGQNPVFLNHFLRSRPMGIQLERLLVGSTFRRLNVSQIRALQLLVPSLTEQREIVARLGVQTEGLDTVIARSHREIGLLREYRARLTADVVTGQVDVREIAATLPDLDPAEFGTEDARDAADNDDDLEEVVDERLEEQ
jgi:type I restriction enzyme, S subunit